MALPNPNIVRKPTILIGMSGPPRSGKDSIGQMLAAIIEDRHGIQPQLLALSTPMREVVYALLGQPYSEQHYETQKDIPQAVFGGATIRQEMIALSEEHVKRRLGNGFWAKSLLERVWDPTPRVIIVTDMGFQAEVDVFLETFGFDHVFYPQVTRPHCSFEGDSRSYVGTDGRKTSIINDGDLQEAAARCYGRMVNQFHMDFS